MIIVNFLEGIIVLLNSIFEIVVPAMPASVLVVFQSILAYMRQGMNIVWLFVDRGLVSQLLNWWITISALIFAVETVYHIWHIVTGNYHPSQPIKESEATTDTEIQDYRGVTVGTSHTTTRRRNIVKF